MDVLIVIPARYASTRLPGKPLQKIAGIEMIRRVAKISQFICDATSELTIHYVVATDDPRIADFCQNVSIPAVMTLSTCRNGTERCLDAVRKLRNPLFHSPDLVINLQGDNPLCPPEMVQSLINAWLHDEATGQFADLYTPYVPLSWEAYDRLVEAKKTTPYTGTTVLVNRDGLAMAFSKSILPVMRKPDSVRNRLSISPIRQHIGLYAYRLETLEQYPSLSISQEEQNDLEGLEQLRFLYHGRKIRMVEVEPKDRPFMGGIDSPEDIVRAENFLRDYGDPWFAP